MESAFLVLAIMTASLEDDRFIVRHAASEYLVTQPLVQVMVAARPMAFGPESRYRQKALWNNFTEYRAKYFVDRLFPTGTTTLPWVDSLLDTFPDRYPIINQCLEAARQDHPTGNYGTGQYPHYRVATRKMIGYLLHSGWEPNKIVELLDDMVANEKIIVARQKAEEDARVAAAAAAAAQGMKPEEP